MVEANPGPNIDSGLDRLWGQLEQVDPKGVCRRAGVTFGNGRYSVPFLGTVYGVQPGARQVLGPPADALARDPEFALVVLGYLAGAREGAPSPAPPGTPASRPWVSERQLPGGSLFFQGPHALPLSPVLARFGRDAQGFRRVCADLGGEPLGYGDAAFAFRVLPRIALGVILWVGDEEFEPRAGVLFEPDVTSHLPLDLVLGLVRAVVIRLETANPPTS